MRPPRTFRQSWAGTGIARLHQALPREFAAHLRGLYMLRLDDELDTTMLRAIRAGWTATSLADAIGLTRERVGQRASLADPGLSTWDVPPPPLASPRPPKVPRWPDLPATEVAELRRLGPLASQVRGRTPADSPARLAAAELNEKVATLWAAGYGIATVARAMGVSNNAIRFRLGRAGVLPLPPSQWGPPR